MTRSRALTSGSESCIKGHRSSSCRHTDRALFEIKKIGRPATQCEHCRELRKTRQIHVKCVCESKDSDGKAGASSKGVLIHSVYFLFILSDLQGLLPSTVSRIKGFGPRRVS